MRDPISTTMGEGGTERERTPMRTVGTQLGIVSGWEVDTNFKLHSLGKDLCSMALTYSELGAIPKFDLLLPLGQSTAHIT